MIILQKARIILIFPTLLLMGLMAGFFYAYSSSVMFGLDRLNDAAFIKAMQHINSAVRNGLFGVGFFGAAALSFVMTLLSLLELRKPSAILTLLACLFYGIGTFGVTVIKNVPLNTELGSVIIETTDTIEAIRRTYYADWTYYNDLRTQASVMAVILLMAALYRLGREK
ncbi:MAG: anthrone oxygenase family protein [Sneathiella sp.]